MDRPLWQIFLALFLLSFALHRAAAAYVVQAGELPPVLFAAYALQALAGLVTAVGLWTGRRFVLGALLALGVAVAATALLEGFFLRVRPAAAAVSEVGVAAIATGALFLLLRRELASDESAP